MKTVTYVTKQNKKTGEVTYTIEETMSLDHDHKLRAMALNWIVA